MGNNSSENRIRARYPLVNDPKNKPELVNDPAKGWLKFNRWTVLTVEETKTASGVWQDTSQGVYNEEQKVLGSYGNSSVGDVSVDDSVA